MMHDENSVVVVKQVACEQDEDRNCRLRSIWYLSIMGKLASWPCVIESKLIPQLLNEYSDHEVNIYEKDSRLGGHTNTVEFKRELLCSMMMVS